MQKVFIVILNWSRKDDTLECLDSIEKMDSKGYELHVIVADNASTDESITAFRKLRPSKYVLDIVENEDNYGFAKGNNIGIMRAVDQNADFILVLNNDIIVHKLLIVKLLKAAKRYQRTGIFSPKIYFSKGFEFKDKYKKNELGKVIWSAGGDIDWDNVYGTNHGVDEVDVGQFDDVRDIDFASGAAMFLRVKAVKDIGVFDEKYYMYLEDLELSQRFKRMGWEVKYIPEAVLWHKVAQSSSIGGDLNDYFITRNRLLFGMKYARLRTKVALKREAMRLKKEGRKWQKQGILDYESKNFEKGSWK